MNIFEREARDIRDFLARNGYTCVRGPDHIIVDDPVWGYKDGRPYGQLPPNKVIVRDWKAALRFVNDRT